MSPTVTGTRKGVVSMSYINEAFSLVCVAAVRQDPGTQWYVSLYERTQQYGGPEEGGWYINASALVAYQEVASEPEAERIAEQVEQLAKRLSDQARHEHAKGCAAQCEWLDARGLDSDWLPEPDGPTMYMVRIENHPGEHTYQGPTHYE